MSEETIFKRTIEKYGIDLQIEVLIEECAELIHVLQKHKRMKIGTPNAKVTVADIIGECVDVELLIEQMRRIFPNERLWNKIRRAKITRLKRRL